MSGTNIHSFTYLHIHFGWFCGFLKKISVFVRLLFCFMFSCLFVGFKLRNIFNKGSSLTLLLFPEPLFFAKGMSMDHLFQVGKFLLLSPPCLPLTAQNGTYFCWLPCLLPQAHLLKVLSSLFPCPKQPSSFILFLLHAFHLNLQLLHLPSLCLSRVI